MNKQCREALEAVRKDLGNWRTFRRTIRLPGRGLVGLIYIMTLILGVLLLGKLLLLNHTMEVTILQVLLLIGVVLVDQPVMLGIWFYVVVAFIGLLATTMVLYWWRRQLSQLYRNWLGGTNEVKTLYLEPLIGDLSLVYTAKSAPTAMLPVALAREADLIDDSRLAFRMSWQQTLQSISSGQLTSRDEILARVINVTRSFESVALVDITTNGVQHHVGLMAIADGQITLAMGIQWHHHILFFKPHRQLQLRRIATESVENRINI